MSDNTLTRFNPNTARVQRHRAKLRAEHRARLDVWIGITVIEKVRAVATRKKLTMREAIHEALQAYVTGYAVADHAPDVIRPESKTARAIRLYDTDPAISAYKAALVTGITPQTLYRALAARERLLSGDGCR